MQILKHLNEMKSHGFFPGLINLRASAAFIFHGRSAYIFMISPFPLYDFGE
jgi:hypothetical protein